MQVIESSAGLCLITDFLYSDDDSPSMTATEHPA